MRANAGWMLLAGLLVSAGAVQAQDPRDPWEGFPGHETGPRSLSIAPVGGLFFSSKWSDLVLLGTISDGGAVEQVLLRQVQVEPGPIAGLQVTYRRGRGGARFQAAYSRSCLAIAGACTGAPAGRGEIPLLRDEIDVHTFMADAVGEVSLVPARKARWARPFALIGFGAVVSDPEGDASQLLPRFIDHGRGDVRTIAANQVSVNFPTGSFLVAVDGVGLETAFAGIVGVGTDLRIPMGGGGIGLRLELADHITSSPMGVSIARLGPGSVHDRTPSKFRFGAVHNIRVMAGITLDFGIRTPVGDARTPYDKR